MKKRKMSGTISDRFMLAFFLLMSLALIFWVLGTQYQPLADQKIVLNIAANLKKHDFSEFLPGGYIAKYPHQKGIVFLIYLLSFLWGDNNYVGFQCLNVVSVLAVYIQMYKLARLLFGKRLTAQAVMLVTVLYFPFALYVSFVYGTLLGLAFSLAAVVCTVNYLMDRSSVHMCKGIFYIALSVLVKNNFLIVLLAIVIYLLIDWIVHRRWKSLALSAAVIVFSSACNQAVVLSLEHITGIERVDGIPSVAWITMGMQEGMFAPGWYNAYNAIIYSENLYDVELCREQATEDLIAALNKFAEQPRYAITFFTKKLASQWSEPTFGSVWLYGNRATQIKPPAIIPQILRGITIYQFPGLFLNVFQSLIYFGAAFYLIMARKDIRWIQLMPGMVFIGGFLFHLLWEAKSQYTLVYFCLLIPYAVSGYERGVSWVDQWNGRQRELNRPIMRRYGPLYVSLLFSAALIGIVTILDSRKGRALRLNYDDKRYPEVLAEESLSYEPVVKNGEYIIKSTVKTGCGIGLEPVAGDEERGVKLRDPGAKIYLYHENPYYIIRFIDTQKVLEVQDGQLADGAGVRQGRFDGKDGQQWRLQMAEDGMHCWIMTGDGLALTMNPESDELMISEWSHSIWQAWMFEQSNATEG